MGHQCVGADHHGHVARMKGAMAALGFDPAQLDVILMQLVRLYRGGQIVRMSKRTGTTVSLDELIEEVGKDAARFTFVMRNPDSHLDFDGTGQTAEHGKPGLLCTICPCPHLQYSARPRLWG